MDIKEKYYCYNSLGILVCINDHKTGLMDRKTMHELNMSCLLDSIIDTVEVSKIPQERQGELIYNILTCLKDNHDSLILEGIKISKDKEGKILIDRELN